jgi:hypothetical protein
MNLHPTLFDYELPPALRKPLVFGDPDQIKSLNAIEAKLKAEELRGKQIASGELNKFEVEVEFTGYQRVTVYAADKDEAKELALEETSVYDCDDMNSEVTWTTEKK